jgi:hypothetical protein
MNVSRVNKKNPMAKYLKDRRYRQLVIKNKKAYNRKKKNDSIRQD